MSDRSIFEPYFVYVCVGVCMKECVCVYVYVYVCFCVFVFVCVITPTLDFILIMWVEVFLCKCVLK